MESMKDNLPPWNRMSNIYWRLTLVADFKQVDKESDRPLNVSIDRLSFCDVMLSPESMGGAN